MHFTTHPELNHKAPDRATPNDIEMTLPMWKAGMDVFLSWDKENEPPELLVAGIFLTMLEARLPNT